LPERSWQKAYFEIEINAIKRCNCIINSTLFRDSLDHKVNLAHRVREDILALRDWWALKGTLEDQEFPENRARKEKS